jgi:hypothetical protein
MVAMIEDEDRERFRAAIRSSERERDYLPWGLVLGTIVFGALGNWLRGNEQPDWSTFDFLVVCLLALALREAINLRVLLLKAEFREQLRQGEVP